MQCYIVHQNFKIVSLLKALISKMLKIPVPPIPPDDFTYKIYQDKCTVLALIGNCIGFSLCLTTSHFYG